MSKLKPCPFCGKAAGYDGDYCGCEHCNKWDWPSNDWNRRAMPGCVRELVACDGIIDHAKHCEGCFVRLVAVRAYYGQE